MSLNTFLKKLKATPTQRKFYGKIGQDKILGEELQSQPIEPNKGYFQIRLSEMFIHNQREYWRGFVPLGVVWSEFVYDGDKQSFPVLVGSGLLKGIQEYVDGENIEYRNTPIIGPVPYREGDVSLFVGLYRTQVTDLAQRLFTVLGKVVGIFDLTMLSEYLKIAGALGDGLLTLLGFEAVEFRLGEADTFGDSSPNQLQDSYLAYINYPENEIAIDKLWVKAGRLYIGESEQTLSPFDGADYCLIRLDARRRRGAYTTLPAYKIWKAARGKIYQGEEPAARRLMMECQQQLSISPDLTDEEAEYLIQAYVANFEQAVSQHQRGFKTKAALRTYRGGEADLLPQDVIEQTVYRAYQAGVSDDVLQGLLTVKDRWQQIPHLAEVSMDNDLTEEMLSEQIDAIASFPHPSSPNPKALAEAITIATLSSQ